MINKIYPSNMIWYTMCKDITSLAKQIQSQQDVLQQYEYETCIKRTQCDNKQLQSYTYMIW